MQLVTNPGARRPTKGRRWLGATVVAALIPAGVAMSGVAGAAPAPTLVHAHGTKLSSSSCPAPPTAPPPNPNYKASGYRWNPEHTINYVVDTNRLKRSQIKRRVADVRRAMREAARYTGLRIHYAGTERTSVSEDAHPQLVQFIYRAQKDAVTENLFSYSSDVHQMEGATIDLRPSVTVGYGKFDNKNPVASPEGHFLLFGVGIMSGLAGVKPTDRQVMNPTYSARYFYRAYQAGDKRGLWKVGVAAGCRGFEF